LECRNGRSRSGGRENGYDVETEIKILPEGSFLVFVSRSRFGSAHDAHVDFDFLIAAHGADFFFPGESATVWLEFPEEVRQPRQKK